VHDEVDLPDRPARLFKKGAINAAPIGSASRRTRRSILVSGR